MFSAEFVASLPSDPRKALREVTGKVIQATTFHKTRKPKDPPTSYAQIVKGVSLITVLLKRIEENYSDDFDLLEIEELDLHNTKRENIESINEYCTILHEWLKVVTDNIETLDILENGVNEYSAMLTGFQGYTFSDKDFSRIQKRINELRSIFANSNEIENDHKSRLLSKLEQLQRELHKKMSSLTKSLGIVVEIGVTIGTFGEKIKPAIDRVREITNVFLKIKSEAEGLPPGQLSTLALPEGHNES